MEQAINITQIILTYANPALVAAITSASGFTIPLVSKIAKAELTNMEKRGVVVATGLLLSGLLAFIEPTIFTSTRELFCIAIASSIASFGGYAGVQNILSKNKKMETIADDGVLHT